MNPYKPEILPIRTLSLEVIVSLVGESNAAIAEYNGLLQAMVNPAIMLSPLTNQEAVLSSKIEGTQATVEEVLGHEAGQEYDERKNTDIKEILNYRHAMIIAQEYLADGRPLGLNLIRQLHQMLMNSVRGHDKEPGEFRKDQNWIGRPGCTIDEATFVPPSPLQLVDYLQAWEAYLGEKDIDPIVQTAIVHAQFELLHPFKDGNGRIGRLIIPLFLYAKKRLTSPTFYMSAFLESNRDEYYERLRGVSQEGDWTAWVKFFLTGVVKQSQINLERARAIIELYDRTKETIRDATRSQHSAQIVDALFYKPIFRVSDICSRTGMPKPTAHTALKKLQEIGLVTQIKKAAGRRPAILAFPELLKISEGKADN